MRHPALYIALVTLICNCSSEPAAKKQTTDSISLSDTTPVLKKEASVEIPFDTLLNKTRSVIFAPTLLSRTGAAAEFLTQQNISFENKYDAQSNTTSLEFEININERDEFFSFTYFYKGKDENAKYKGFDIRSKLKPSNMDTCFASLTALFSNYKRLQQYRFKKNWGIEGYVWTKEKSDYKQLILMKKDHNEKVVHAKQVDDRWVDTNEFME